jgi:hypothetical protein
MIATHEYTTPLTVETINPGHGVLPTGLGVIGQLKEFRQLIERNIFRLQPWPCNAAQLQSCLRDHPCQPHATDCGFKPFSRLIWAAHNGLTICSEQVDTLNMITKRAQDVVIFAMDIVGNGPAHCDQLSAWSDRQHPALWNCQALDIAQQDAGFTRQQALLSVKGYEPV